MPFRLIASRRARRLLGQCIPAGVAFFAAAISGCAPKFASEQPPANATCKAPPEQTNQTPARIPYRAQGIQLKGFNVAWFDFAKDFGPVLDEVRLRAALSDVRAAGGNSLRWWLHVDGAFTPQWGEVNGEQRVVGPGPHVINTFRKALDIAGEYDVYLLPSLWSFDMLFDNGYRKPPNHANAQLLLDDVVLQSYIDNALIPMVAALNDHPNLVAWELFNEPENMTEPWFVQKPHFYGGPVPTLMRLQRVQALMAAAVHRTALAHGQQALVTTGSKSVAKYNSDVAGGYNYYRDDRMIAAADGNGLATLDFYAPHYYNNEDCDGAWSPFHHHASRWGLDKPIVLGEFHAHEPLDVLGEPIAATALCQAALTQGYAGGYSWQWNEYREALMACRW